MLLPETKEREFRFRLALRMGLPIFGLVSILISNTLITSYESLDPIFYFEATLLLAFSIFFIFYLIYNGYEERITEPVSRTFTREYLYKYLLKQIEQNETYTVILVSIDNLNDINEIYGIKNGDKVLYETSHNVASFLKEKGLSNFPLGHLKGGDFLIGLKGEKTEYKSLLELFCLKSEEYKVDDIEVSISGSIIDTNFSHNLDHMIERLFDLQQITKSKKIDSSEHINPSELESSVIHALTNKQLLLMGQKVYEGEDVAFEECFVKLKGYEGKVLHQKSFMKVVNRLGLGVEYDLLVLQSILYKIEQTDTKFAIAITPSSLRNRTFLHKAQGLLASMPKAKKKIIFILHEREYYPNIERFKQSIDLFREIGIEIAIDRLGALHSSFLYLRDLDIDMVRVDGQYTKELLKDREILEGFCMMAHAKNAKFWTKMVENEEQKEVYKIMNIDYTQGKFLAPLEKIYESE